MSPLHVTYLKLLLYLIENVVIQSHQMQKSCWKVLSTVDDEEMLYLSKIVNENFWQFVVDY